MTLCTIVAKSVSYTPRITCWASSSVVLLLLLLLLKLVSNVTRRPRNARRLSQVVRGRRRLGRHRFLGLIGPTIHGHSLFGVEFAVTHWRQRGIMSVNEMRHFVMEATDLRKTTLIAASPFCHACGGATDEPVFFHPRLFSRPARLAAL